jgi:zinc transporter ZupT
MKHVSLTVPELGLIAGTRAALGAGLALLLGDRLSPEQRRAVGWTLLAVGIMTTGPLVAAVLKGSQSTSEPDKSTAV